MLIIVKHKCASCKYWDMGDNVCHMFHFIDGLTEYEVIAECEDYYRKEGD